ncbi:MAG: 2-oxoacid:acceptor oxidoreductase subunit alpha [Sphaerochaetaceae bacterium]|nr:2-oxoacid:acceptor oxidoreductase subunit alpha [Sphaerochaetaceae bacterium]
MDTSYSIVLSGEAGQGLKTIESLFMAMLQKSGYHAFLSKEFMSRVRGGNNTTQIRVADHEVFAPIDRIDLLVVLSRDGLKRLEKRISAQTIIIGEKTFIESEQTPAILKPIAVSERMKELGSAIYANNLVAGLLAGLLSCKVDVAHTMIHNQFSSKGEEVVNKNLLAFDMGLKIAKTLGIDISISTDDQVMKKVALNGSASIGIGAIAGGCDFIASYPMSPSTAVLAYLAGKARQYGIVVEQAEDEIAAINMALGAWYAGARAMVTTSGGGFALMTEGVSLAGGTETPAVIHLAQRPGPATGLPTRTEQGDLNLALYAGHGDFERVIFAPGTFDEGIRLAHRAFETADAFQVPVFLLTDQYYLDSEAFTERIDFSTLPVSRHIVQTKHDYKRYAITESGISPRGIPGYGDGLVCVDSDEHTEEGRITEDFDVRIAMVDKRLRKLRAYNDVAPTVIGPKDYSHLVVCWGSTFGPLKEAVGQLKDAKIALAHFSQVYPLPKQTESLLRQAKKLILVENNATGQFGDLIKRDLGIECSEKILKYNGLQFTVEELVDHLKGAIR